MLIPLFMLWIAGSPSRRRCKRLRLARATLLTTDYQAPTVPGAESGSLRTRRTERTAGPDLTLLDRAAA